MSSVTAAPAPRSLPKRLAEEFEHKWSYFSKFTGMCRHALTASTKRPEVLNIAGPDFPDKVKYITTRMKFTTIVGVPFSVAALKSTAQKIFDSINLRDREGAALGLLSFTVISADIADAVTTFVNAVLEAASKQAIPFFSAVGLPLGYTMVVLGTVTRTIQIAKTCGLYSSLRNATNTTEDRIKFRSLLESKFGLTTTEKGLMLSEDEKQKLLERKHADLKRAAPPEAVAELKEIREMLKRYSLYDHEVSKKIEHVQNLLIKKIGVDAINLGANMVSFSALCMFSFSIPGAMPFFLLSTSLFMRITGSLVQDLSKP